MFRSRKISNVEKTMNEFGIDTRSGFGKFTLEKIIALKLQDKVIHHIDIQRLMSDGGISSFIIEGSDLVGDLADGEYRSDPNGPHWLIGVCDYEEVDWRYYHYYPETDSDKETDWINRYV